MLPKGTLGLAATDSNPRLFCFCLPASLAGAIEAFVSGGLEGEAKTISSGTPTATKSSRSTRSGVHNVEFHNLAFLPCIWSLQANVFVFFLVARNIIVKKKVPLWHTMPFTRECLVSTVVI
jgi:hypothetical protein